jgi:hypothetical protein
VEDDVSKDELCLIHENCTPDKWKIIEKDV